MLDLAQDRRSRGRPDEGPRVLVVFANVAANGGDQLRHTAEGCPPQPLAGDLGEEAFDEVQPRGPSRGEVEMKARVLGEPRLHSGMLVGAVVVEDEVKVLAPGCPAVDGGQE